MAGVMARHLETMRNKHAITLEHLRMGALKGIILDADGSTLYNLYDEFGIAPEDDQLRLANADSTNVRQKCVDTLAQIEDNLRGEFMTDVRCLCSPEFFEKLIAHPKVEKAYENFQQGAILRDDVRTGFTFGGITFEEYRGQATDGNGHRALHRSRRSACLPGGHHRHLRHLRGTGGLQRDGQYPGPAALRQAGPRKFERGTDLHTQSNPLPMCHRPGVLVKLTMS
jgi:hypothetical protein